MNAAPRIEAFWRPVRRTWAGEASPVPLELFRIGLALLVLLRSTDILWPWITLDHYRWHSSDVGPHLAAPLEPQLFSPLVPLPNLSASAQAWGSRVRSTLAVLLLLGVRTRLTAFALFVVGYGLMALDRYRYLHHLHLLWTSCLWLSLCAGPSRWSVERLFRPAPEPSPRWSLQLLRAQCLIVYAAAVVAKLNPRWLSGATLEQLAHARLAGGPLFDAASARLGLSGLAIGVAAAELLLVGLLATPRLRLFGLVLAVALHASLEASMMLSTFSAQMGLYLMLFLPWREHAPQAAGTRLARSRAQGPAATDSAGAHGFRA